MDSSVKYDAPCPLNYDVMSARHEEIQRKEGHDVYKMQKQSDYHNIRTKRANFRGSPLFQATYNIKTEKQTINSTYLVSVRCSEAGGGKKARD